MGTTLTGKIVADTYDALIKVTDNNTITGTKKRMTDGLGNDTPLLISSTDVQVDGNFLTESVQFNTATLQTADAVGKLAWNDQDGTLDLRLKGGNVTLQIGQEELARVVNKTGVNLLESEYKAVKVDGAQGNRLKVALAQADDDANSAETIGIVTETINDNQEGFITTNGLVRGINTTGSIQGETWADGDMLYLSGTVAGQLTNIKPVAPIHTVIMGYVVSAHITQGQIYVKVDNGYELNELHNVLITTPANNELLSYDTATSLWKNKSLSTIGGISGTGFTNAIPIFTGTNTIGSSLLSAVSTTLSSGYAVMNIGNNAYVSNGVTDAIFGNRFAANTVFTTNSTERMRIDSAGNVGIGTTSPSAKFHVNGGDSVFGNGNLTRILGASQVIDFTNAAQSTYVAGRINGLNLKLYTNAGSGIDIDSAGKVGIGIASPALPFHLYNSAAALAYFETTSASGAYVIWRNSGTSFGDVGSQLGISGTGSASNFMVASRGGDLILGTGSSERMRIDSTGNAGIGTSSPISIGGHTGVLTLYGSNATALVLQDAVSRKDIRLNDGNLNFTNSAGTSHFYIADGGEIGIGSTTITGYNIRNSKIITGAATSYGIRIDGTVQSGATSDGIYFGSLASTQAATFSTYISNFRAEQGTFGAGSTVVEQYGFIATSSLIGATRNYGFRGLIPAGTNRWNLYMDGTATNYLSGVLTIGTTSPNASAKVQIDTTTQGFLPPRMTSAQRTAIASPATGLIVYQTDGTEGLYIKKSGAWALITAV